MFVAILTFKKLFRPPQHLAGAVSHPSMLRRSNRHASPQEDHGHKPTTDPSPWSLWSWRSSSAWSWSIWRGLLIWSWRLLEYQLSLQQVPDFTCRLITYFLTNRTQRVMLGRNSSRSTCTVFPQGYVLSPPLFSLHQQLCLPPPISKLLKFADDTILVGLISNGDELA